MNDVNKSIRIGLLGGVDSGKSSLLGVLKTNKLDDGRGSSRKAIMYHKHEKLTGRTSSVTSEYINLNNELITFIDLAGHESYLKTTIYGLYGLNLDLVFILIGSNMGINKMTKEHFNLAKFLDIPIIFIINKIDICPENIINETYKNLNKIVQTFTENQKNLIIFESNDLINNINNYKTLFFNDNNNNILLNNNIENIININEIIENKKKKYNNISFNKDFFEKNYPLLFISNKNGYGIDNLKYLLNKIIYNSYIINKFNNNINNYNINNQDKDNNINTFIIQNTYNVNGIGIVFFGYVKYGIINKNDILSIGPFNNNFYKISIRNIRNIYDNDVPRLYKNNFGCLAIKQLEKTYIFKKNSIRKGIYITNTPHCYKEFIAKVFILHHPTTIKPNYQSTIHCGTVIQAAKVLEILNIKGSRTYIENNNNNNKGIKYLRSGDVAKVKFLFLFRPEFIEKNSMFIFRENNSKGIGKIIDVI